MPSYRQQLPQQHNSTTTSKAALMSRPEETDAMDAETALHDGLRRSGSGSASRALSSCSSRSSGSSGGRHDGDAAARRRRRKSRQHSLSSDRVSTGSSRSSGSARSSGSGAADGALNLPLDRDFLPLPHDQDEEETSVETAPRDPEAAARDHVRHDVLCMLFDLPRATVFYQDFSCAIAASLAMHGRMYPTSSHVCFYSNVFGRERKILIPYESIAELAKTTTMVFQNAIRIRTTDGHEDYTFASFWGTNRDSCFDLIAKTRDRVLKELRPSSLNGVQRLAGSCSPAQSVSSQGPSSPAKSSGPPSTGGQEDAALPAEVEEEAQPAADTSDSNGPAEKEEVTPARRQRQRSVVSDVERIAPKDISMTLVLEETFPVSVGKFMALFFLDDAPFGMDKYGEMTGATEMTVNPWMTPLEDEEAFGMTRSQQFRVPVEAPIGPKSSRVDVLQCLKEERDVRVVETSTRLADIPYGDYFSVEDRWTIVPHSANPDTCQVTIELKVVFGKSTFWKSAIESRAIGDNKDKWQRWVVMAKQFLERRKTQASDQDDHNARNQQEPTAEAPAERQPHRQSIGERRRSGRSMSMGQDRHRSAPHHRSSSSSSRARATGVALRTRNVHVKVFPWILVLVLLVVVVRLQMTLSTIEASLELTAQRVLLVQQQLAQLQAAACPAQPFIQ